MSTGLILLIMFLWSLMGVKTWAFALKDLATEDQDRLTVLSYSFVGALWPLTYIILALILIFGVNSQSLGSSVSIIKKAWRRK